MQKSLVVACVVVVAVALAAVDARRLSGTGQPKYTSVGGPRQSRDDAPLNRRYLMKDLADPTTNFLFNVLNYGAKGTCCRRHGPRGPLWCNS